MRGEMFNYTLYLSRFSFKRIKGLDVHIVLLNQFKNHVLTILAHA